MDIYRIYVRRMAGGSWQPDCGDGCSRVPLEYTELSHAKERFDYLVRREKQNRVLAAGFPFGVNEDHAVAIFKLGTVPVEEFSDAAYPPANLADLGGSAGVPEAAGAGAPAVAQVQGS